MPIWKSDGVKWTSNIYGFNAEDIWVRVLHTPWKGAIRYNFLAQGSKELHMDDMGEPHREDGPAEILADGTERWYIHGKQIK
jgi:hypothetical protein